MNKKARAGWLAGVAVVVSMGLAACGSASPDSNTSGSPDAASTELSIVAYSVAQAPNQAVQAAFAKTDEGKGVTWVESYGASGDQSRQFRLPIANSDVLGDDRPPAPSNLGEPVFVTRVRGEVSVVGVDFGS